MDDKIPGETWDAPVVRLTTLWKPACVGLVLLAVAIYAALVIREISVRTDLGTEYRAHVEVNHGSLDDEAILGAVWAHEHHPYDATWCPDYSPSFRRGCAQAAPDRSVDFGKRP